MQKHFAVVTGVAMVAVAVVVVFQTQGSDMSGFLQFGGGMSSSNPPSPPLSTSSASSSSCGIYEPWCPNSSRPGSGTCCRVDFDCDESDGSCNDPNTPPPPVACVEKKSQKGPTGLTGRGSTEEAALEELIQKIDDFCGNWIPIVPPCDPGCVGEVVEDKLVDFENSKCQLVATNLHICQNRVTCFATRRCTKLLDPDEI